MSTVAVCEAGLDDWPMLEVFFRKHYREGHPLRKREYFAWLVERDDYGHSFIAVVEDRVVAHRAVVIGGGVAWAILLFVEEDHRGQGLVGELRQLARPYAPIASTNANDVALRVHRRRGWIRYLDLQRFVAVNPREDRTTSLVESTDVDVDWPSPSSGHYWKQPGLLGVELPTGDTAVRQDKIGGMRIIDLVEPEEVLNEAWAAGYRWVDFMTSWNDPLCETLEDANWFINDRCLVPWLVDPVVPGSMARVSVSSEEPLPKDLIIKRSFFLC